MLGLGLRVYRAKVFLADLNKGMEELIPIVAPIIFPVMQ